MINYKSTIVFGALLLISVFSMAQESRLESAFNFYQNHNLDSAKANIDFVIADPQYANDGQAWLIYAFIYKELYSKKEKGNIQSPLRLIALNSFKKSLQLDTTQENTQQCINGIKYLASTLYNDNALNLNKENYKVAIKNYAIFKEYYFLADASSANVKKFDIEFNLALSTLYTNLSEADSASKMTFFNLAKDAYTKVLAIDANNIKANYGLGVLYYNHAIAIIKQSEYDIDLVTLNDIQNNSKDLFKESLPFMEKAYKLDPKKAETLIGLSGIYYSLNEKEKSDLFKQKLEEVKKQK